MTTRSGRSYRKSGEMASEELASFLENLFCRFLSYCIILVVFKRTELCAFHSVEFKIENVHRSGSLHLVAAMGFKKVL